MNTSENLIETIFYYAFCFIVGFLFGIIITLTKGFNWTEDSLNANKIIKKSPMTIQNSPESKGKTKNSEGN